MLFVVLVLEVLAPGVVGYITGAPDKDVSCNQMLPNPSVHNGQPQTTVAPYQITSSSSTYQPGQAITVTLSSPVSGTVFRGFLLQARPVNGAVRVGSFPTPLPPNSTQTCQNNGGGSVTQTENSDKASFNITWLAPNDTSAGDINFLATFIQMKSIYWVEVMSYAVRSSVIAAAVTTQANNPAVTTQANNPAVTTQANNPAVTTQANNPAVTTQANNPQTSATAQVTPPNSGRNNRPACWTITGLIALIIFISAT